MMLTLLFWSSMLLFPISTIVFGTIVVAVEKLWTSALEQMFSKWLSMSDFCPFTKINYYCKIGVEWQQHQIYFQVRANHVIKWDWISVRRKQTYFSIRCFVHGLHCNGYIEVRSTKAKINKYSFILFMRL